MARSRLAAWLPASRALWLMIGLGLAFRVVVAFSTYGVAFDINSYAIVEAQLQRDPLALYSSLVLPIGEIEALRWPYPPGFFRLDPGQRSGREHARPSLPRPHPAALDRRRRRSGAARLRLPRPARAERVHVPGGRRPDCPRPLVHGRLRLPRSDRLDRLPAGGRGLDRVGEQALRAARCHRRSADRGRRRDQDRAAAAVAGSACPRRARCARR